jgi:hypothetical protein
LAFSKTVVQRSNINSAVNIACKFKCYISKSKLVISECIIAFIAFTLHEIKPSVQFFWDIRYIKIDLHFATCGAIDILRPLSVLKCVQSNEIVPYNVKVHISTESVYFHRWELGIKLLKINSFYSLGLKLMNWTSIKYLRRAGIGLLNN